MIVQKGFNASPLAFIGGHTYRVIAVARLTAQYPDRTPACSLNHYLRQLIRSHMTSKMPWR